jgi:hypothetical protein
MEFNETDLIEFFGGAPLSADSEGKEFFGSSHFEVVRGEWTLSISFSPQTPMVMADLYHPSQEDPIVCVELQNVCAVRINRHSRTLVVLSRTEDSNGSESTLKERMSIRIDPVKIFTSG